MMQLLQFIFQNIEHFVGTCLLIILCIATIDVLFTGIVNIINAFKGKK